MRRLRKSDQGGTWFARISRGQWVVALCCPLCAETFEKSPRVYIRRIETLELMRQSQRHSPVND